MTHRGQSAATRIQKKYFVQARLFGSLMIDEERGEGAWNGEVQIMELEFWVNF